MHASHQVRCWACPDATWCSISTFVVNVCIHNLVSVGMHSICSEEQNTQRICSLVSGEGSCDPYPHLAIGPTPPRGAEGPRQLICMHRTHLLNALCSNCLSHCCLKPRQSWVSQHFCTSGSRHVVLATYTDSSTVAITLCAGGDVNYNLFTSLHCESFRWFSSLWRTQGGSPFCEQFHNPFLSTYQSVTCFPTQVFNTRLPNQVPQIILVCLPIFATVMCFL